MAVVTVGATHASLTLTDWGRLQCCSVASDAKVGSVRGRFSVAGQTMARLARPLACPQPSTTTVPSGQRERSIWSVPELRNPRNALQHQRGIEHRAHGHGLVLPRPVLHRAVSMPVGRSISPGHDVSLLERCHTGDSPDSQCTCALTLTHQLGM